MEIAISAAQSDAIMNKRLASFSKQEMASGFAAALLDLTGEVYEVEILTVEPHPEDEADIRLWARRVDDSEIPDAEKG